MRKIDVDIKMDVRNKKIPMVDIYRAIDELKGRKLIVESDDGEKVSIADFAYERINEEIISYLLDCKNNTVVVKDAEEVITAGITMVVGLKDGGIDVQLGCVCVKILKYLMGKNENRMKLLEEFVSNGIHIFKLKEEVKNI